MDLKLTIDLSIIAISLKCYILLMFTSNRFLTDCLLVKPADKTILKIRNLSAGQVGNNSVGSLGNGNLPGWSCRTTCLRRSRTGRARSASVGSSPSRSDSRRWNSDGRDFWARLDP